MVRCSFCGRLHTSAQRETTAGCCRGLRRASWSLASLRNGVASVRIPHALDSSSRWPLIANPGGAQATLPPMARPLAVHGVHPLGGLQALGFLRVAASEPGSSDRARAGGAASDNPCLPIATTARTSFQRDEPHARRGRFEERRRAAAGWRSPRWRPRDQIHPAALGVDGRPRVPARNQDEFVVDDRSELRQVGG
jgi:hypothetical protein